MLQQYRHGAEINGINCLLKIDLGGLAEVGEKMDGGMEVGKKKEERRKGRKAFICLFHGSIYRQSNSAPVPIVAVSKLISCL